MTRLGARGGETVRLGSTQALSLALYLALYLALSLGLSLGLPVGAAAGPFDGLYRPNYDWARGWDCETIGRDGGALSVAEDRLVAVENSCALSDPVEIRDMDAVLYDATCDGEGATTAGRIMLMRHDYGIYVIRDGFVLDWISCGGEGE